MTLPVALSGTDVIGQAKTGTGKTLGFGLPLLERVTVPADVEAGRARPDQLSEAPQALVVVPTRELCTQVTNDLLTAGKVRNVRVLAIYGGRAYEPQVEALRKGVDVIVGTPGRLLDLAGQKKLDLSQVRALVLDEADEMLDLGFLPDVEKIIQLLPAKRQTMLFSATMPGAVIGLARRYMSQPTHIRATAPDDEGATVANITQRVYRAHSMDKPEMVSRILQAEGRGLAMIFCRTKRTAADIADQLARRGFASGAVHGDLGQGAREQALRAFRNGKVDVLVCTDVAARGIDVEGVTHVINYQSPEDEKTYLHRVGRTGRAGASGTAVTLVDWDDIPRWQLINKALDLKFPDPVETYSTSPHLFEELGIPAGTKGVLPRAERTRAGLAAEELEDLGETGARGRRSPSAPAPAREERPARTRPPRQRRRTRGGSTVESTGTAAEPQRSTDSPVSPDATAPRTPRRRRRTRAGASSAGIPAAGAPAQAVEKPQAVVEEPTAVATAAEPLPQQAPAAEAVVSAPRRRRTRAVKAVDTVEATVAPVVPAPAPAVDDAPEPEVKPRRTRTVKKAAVKAMETAESTTAAETAEAETKPRRTRTTKKAAEAVETAEATETAVATPRRTRTVKKAAQAVETTEATEAAVSTPRRTRTAKKTAETAVETAEGTEAVKPTTRRRATKATASAEAAVDAPEAEVKPRRTRTVKKAAVKAMETAEGTTAAETVEAETKPRRTRTTKKAAEAVETAEATEAKPRRTRTVKKAAEAVETTEATETAVATPRRTRTAKKTAETAEVTDGTEVKPRRTRATAKKAAPKTAAAPTEG
ncbi:DEAD/DEAH box helicase [Streptomyces clavuligerus]|uniref:RNA helicase n=8 Tax=Streptomyces clavuligerus TaxID=1901 RepID=E2Q4U1_STRCL|nr:DEAD/DEAH box helicase [Streptomyces clavuligerus]ANW18283.1 DEAD/DEAH box helicase [Streptomyces clavuligerus]AXU12846.1 DEAD/DEAH box helicase [Streptomyces clavuligerus]EFG09100.1 ATP-dependent RNA helicase [Streptomyces clavuligerus]MBY6302761.1 DEAD/DEAH box helicase [Streptomyces clavuligerus]QCS05630.1 DEAD/DEAH box helicase [Streptomyces clavuligerus]